MTQSTKEEITKDMTIESIFSFFPQKAQRLAQELTQAGLHCVGCHASTYETLEAGVLGHGFSEAHLDKLLKKLNDVLAEQQNLSTITLSVRAAQKYLEILHEDGKAGWGMRLAEQPGGCGGYEHSLDYSEKASADDVIFVSQGIEIHVSKNQKDRLLGTQIEWIDGLHGAGFKISNPNVKSACGCGHSHNY